MSGHDVRACWRLGRLLQAAALGLRGFMAAQFTSCTPGHRSQCAAAAAAASPEIIFRIVVLPGSRDLACAVKAVPVVARHTILMPHLVCDVAGRTCIRSCGWPASSGSSYVAGHLAATSTCTTHGPSCFACPPPAAWVSCCSAPHVNACVCGWMSCVNTAGLSLGTCWGDTRASTAPTMALQAQPLIPMC